VLKAAIARQIIPNVFSDLGATLKKPHPIMVLQAIIEDRFVICKRPIIN
jgi:hypothetical protein